MEQTRKLPPLEVPKSLQDVKTDLVQLFLTNMTSDEVKPSSCDSCHMLKMALWVAMLVLPDHRCCLGMTQFQATCALCNVGNVLQLCLLCHYCVLLVWRFGLSSGGLHVCARIQISTCLGVYRPSVYKP